jgi:hypothetical protein
MQWRKALQVLCAAAILVNIIIVPVLAQQADPTKEQFVPILIYRTGPYAAGGSGIMVAAH